MGGLFYLYFFFCGVYRTTRGTLVFFSVSLLLHSIIAVLFLFHSVFSPSPYTVLGRHGRWGKGLYVPSVGTLFAVYKDGSDCLVKGGV